MSYPGFNAAQINGAASGASGGGAGFRVSSLYPVSMGQPSLVERPAESSAFTIDSLVPVRIGTPEVRFGMLPGGLTMQAQSLRPVAFGRPSLQAVLHAGPTPSLTLARFGQPRLVAGLRAQSMRPVSFGVPGLVTVAHVDASRPARFGGPSLRLGFSMAGLKAGRLGSPRLKLAGLSFTPESLQPVSCGSPVLGGMAMRVRTLCPVRFGRPTLDRGAAC